MSQFFTLKQESLMAKLKVLRQMVNEQELRDAPCPLPVSQLEELRVFTGKLAEVTSKLLTDLKGKA